MRLELRTGVIQTVVAGGTIKVSGRHRRVLPKCCDNRSGRWLCISCSKVFKNQDEKDRHIATGNHLLAWECFHHGYEEP